MLFMVLSLSSIRTAPFFRYISSCVYSICIVLTCRYFYLCPPLPVANNDSKGIQKEYNKLLYFFFVFLRGGGGPYKRVLTSFPFLVTHNGKNSITTTAVARDTLRRDYMKRSAATTWKQNTLQQPQQPRGRYCPAPGACCWLRRGAERSPALHRKKLSFPILLWTAKKGFFTAEKLSCNNIYWT